MEKQTYTWKPFLPVFIFVLVIAIIYTIGKSTFFNKSKGISTKQSTGVGSVAPDFVIKDVYGLEASLSKVYQIKPVLLIFWASWCPYCAQELPDLLRFGNIYQEDIQIVLVLSGESKQTIEAYRSSKKIPFLTALDTSRAIWQMYNVIGTPHHFVINREGTIIENKSGVLSLSMLKNITINAR